MATKQEGGDPAPPVAEAAQPDPDVQKLWDALEKFDLPRKKVFELLAPHSEKIQKSLEFFDIPRQAIDIAIDPLRYTSAKEAGPEALESFWSEQEGKLEKQ